MLPSTLVRRTGRFSLLALASALVSFAAIQALLCLAVECQPALRDPEFAEKLHRLRKLRALYPNRPLLLIVGSSRSSCGLQPSSMRLPAADGGASPLVFNMAITGCGPIQQLAIIERLDRYGIRPRWILAELHPLLLHQRPGQWGEEDWMRPEKLDWRDLAVVGSYLPQPKQWLSRWAQLRSLPAWYLRFPLLNYLAPGWLDTRLRQDGAWYDLDDYGWLPLVAADDDSSEERRRLAHVQYAPAMRKFEVSAAPDAALRRLVQTGRRKGASVAFYLMPEGDTFRSWYPVDIRRRLTAYLSGLRREEDVTVFDATAWCRESDFADSHHLRSVAASRFSRRFGREIAVPFVTCRQVEEAENTYRRFPNGPIAALSRNPAPKTNRKIQKSNPTKER